MTKKYKRQMRKESDPQTAAEFTTTSAGRTSEFTPDYGYVVKDLRRIGLLAGTFVGILVVLAFVMPLIMR